MTEERSCKTCQFHFGNSKLGVICDKIVGLCHCYSKWQPIAQEKPIENKVIFESEEQFVNFWKDLTGCDCLPGTKERIKQKGYIRKSAVEEAEEMYNEHFNSHLARGYDLNQVNEALGRANNLIKKLYLAIQELKSEIEVLG